MIDIIVSQALHHMNGIRVKKMDESESNEGTSPGHKSYGSGARRLSLLVVHNI